MIAPLKCKNGLRFTATETTDVRMGTFLCGKHLTEKKFCSKLGKNGESTSATHSPARTKHGRDNLWYNEDVQLHELGNVMNKLHNTSCLFDENHFLTQDDCHIWSKFSYMSRESFQHPAKT